MVSPGIPYRTGPRALIFMMLRKMKYPLILVLLMIAISGALHYGSLPLSHLLGGHAELLKKTMVVLNGIQKYGWIFTVLLGFFLALSVVPEYRGLTITVGDKALAVRGGVITYQEIAIPYRQIQTINIVEEAMPRLFGLCSLVIVTSAQNNMQTENDESEALIELIHKSLAVELRDAILSRLNSANS